MVSGAVVISSQTTSVRAANLLASFIIVPMAELIIAESLIMFWGRYHILWWIVGALALIAVVLARMGLRLFNREELLGREFDMINFRWALRRFGAIFKGGARNPVEWYRGLLKGSLPRLALPMLITAIGLVAAYAIGFDTASTFTLPDNLLKFERVDAEFGERLRQFGMMSTRGWLWILWNNIRALGFAALMGGFTFGVLAIILLMTPIGLIGYFAGNVALAGGDVARVMSALVIPHALLEVPAAIIAGGAMLRLGLSALSVRDGTSLGEGFIEGLAEWTRISLGLVLPLLVLAAAIESFITPRIAIMLLTGP
jgi:uncharacterized membrane protein SpoIIM required for sporulation